MENIKLQEYKNRIKILKDGTLLKIYNFLKNEKIIN